jgi:uncharacterized protein
MKKKGILEDWEERFCVWMTSSREFKDGSHDMGHFRRVWKTARYINREEGGPGDELILLAAAYFHDLVSLPKNHPDRKEASRLSAEQAGELLEGYFGDYPQEKIEGVRHAILAHSFSAGVEAVSAEAKILQDADRLEAVGAIGLARVFYTAGQLNASLYDELDPLAERREPDDRRYALDHFQVKLLKLPALMNTATGRGLAELNADYLREFMRKLLAEIKGEWGGF